MLTMTRIAFALRWKVQTANTLAVDALVRAGYDGELLRATLKPKKDDKKPITQLRTKERQELDVGQFSVWYKYLLWARPAKARR